MGFAGNLVIFPPILKIY